jgi:hypothetical protein
LTLRLPPAVRAFVGDHLSERSEVDNVGRAAGLFLHRGLAGETEDYRRPDVRKVQAITHDGNKTARKGACSHPVASRMQILRWTCRPTVAGAIRPSQALQCVCRERGRAIACGALRFLHGSTFLLALVFAPCPHQSPPRSSSCERLEPRRDPLQPSGAQSQETVEREKVTWPGLNGLPTICPNSLMLLYAANGVGAGGRLECK